MKKIFIFTILLSLILTGCTSVKKQDKQTAIDNSNFFDFNQYEDADDVPDWKGELLKLQLWVYAGGPNAENKGKVSQNDVVTPEIKRITGIEFDKEDSFDNNGDSFDVKIAKMIASNEFPHATSSILNPENLIKKDYLWRLDEYLPKYAPNLYKYFGPDSIWGEEWQRQLQTYGGVYDIPIAVNKPLLRDMVDIDKTMNLTKEQVDNIVGPDQSPYGYFYIRDDILKQIYPQAKSAEELKEIYMQNGKFTKEEMMDIPIDSKEDFVDLLYKIKALGIKEGNREVYPIYTHCGGDNWPLLVGLGNMMGYNANLLDANYFTYWDKETKKVEYAFKQDWFKDVLKLYNQMVKDGVASEEALLDTDGIFKEKLNNGLYAVSYYTHIPDKNLMKEKPYKYRKVYARYKMNSDKFLTTTLDPNEGSGRHSFFKARLNEQQLIQVIRMYDFMASKPGQRLYYWGPKSAGLFTQKDGIRTYTDKELEDCVVYNTMNEKDLYYNIAGKLAWPGYPHINGSEYHPLAYYKKEIKEENWDSQFNMGYIEEIKRVKSKTPSLWKQVDEIPEVKKFWDARKSFEDALQKIFASKDDEKFEQLYNEMISIAERNGLTEQTLEEFNKVYTEQYNAKYIENLR